MKKKISIALFFAVIIVICIFRFHKREVSFEKLTGGAEPYRIMVIEPLKNDNAGVFGQTLDENEAYKIKEILSGCLYEKKDDTWYYSFRDGSDEMRIMTIDLARGDGEKPEYIGQVSMSSEHAQLIFSMDDKSTAVIPVDGETEDIYCSIMGIFEM